MNVLVIILTSVVTLISLSKHATCQENIQGEISTFSFLNYGEGYKIPHKFFTFFTFSKEDNRFDSTALNCISNHFPFYGGGPNGLSTTVIGSPMDSCQVDIVCDFIRYNIFKFTQDSTCLNNKMIICTNLGEIGTIYGKKNINKFINTICRLEGISEKNKKLFREYYLIE